jgi:hypothetical protein
VSSTKTSQASRILELDISHERTNATSIFFLVEMSIIKALCLTFMTGAALVSMCLARTVAIQKHAFSLISLIAYLSRDQRSSVPQLLSSKGMMTSITGHNARRMLALFPEPFKSSSPRSAFVDPGKRLDPSCSRQHERAAISADHQSPPRFT